jgi:hypothetical protein
MEEGNALVEKIETFKTKNGRLPNSLEDIGMEEKDGDVVYYTKKDSLHYIVFFGVSMDESKIYFSDSKRWEDRYRKMR